MNPPFRRVFLCPDQKSVPKQTESLWEPFGQYFLWLKMVTDVGEQDLLCPTSLAHINGRLQVEVAVVWFIPECIQDEEAAAFDLFQFGIFNVIGVGQVADRPKAETHHWKIAVPGMDQGEFQTCDALDIVLKRKDIDLGDAGIVWVVKDVGVLFPEACGHFRAAVDRHGSSTFEDQRPEVIQASGVVLMRVGQRYGINGT